MARRPRVESADEGVKVDRGYVTLRRDPRMPKLTVVGMGTAAG
jgi:hypothetical protein